jgi:hypothetical protein
MFMCRLGAAVILVVWLGLCRGMSSDASAATPELVSIAVDGSPLPNSFSPSISADGRFVAFATGRLILVRDRSTQTTLTVYEGSGVTGPAISGDGQIVAFIALMPDMMCPPPPPFSKFQIFGFGLFVRDRGTD